MKNFHQIALGLMAGALALSFSAFTAAPKKTLSDWYEPTSNTLSVTDPAAQNFSSYNSTPLPADPGDCPGDTYVCAAEFPDTGSAPTHIYDIDR